MVKLLCTLAISIHVGTCSGRNKSQKLVGHFFLKIGHFVGFRKRQKFEVAKVWQIWRIDKIHQTFICQLTMRPQDV